MKYYYKKYASNITGNSTYRTKVIAFMKEVYRALSYDCIQMVFEPLLEDYESKVMNHSNSANILKIHNGDIKGLKEYELIAAVGDVIKLAYGGVYDLNLAPLIEISNNNILIKKLDVELVKELGEKITSDVCGERFDEISGIDNTLDNPPDVIKYVSRVLASIEKVLSNNEKFSKNTFTLTKKINHIEEYLTIVSKGGYIKEYRINEDLSDIKESTMKIISNLPISSKSVLDREVDEKDNRRVERLLVLLNKNIESLSKKGIQFVVETSSTGVKLVVVKFTDKEAENDTILKIHPELLISNKKGLLYKKGTENGSLSEYIKENIKNLDISKEQSYLFKHVLEAFDLRKTVVIENVKI